MTAHYVSRVSALYSARKGLRGGGEGDGDYGESLTPQSLLSLHPFLCEM